MQQRYRFLRFPEGRAKAFTFSYDDGCPEDVRFSDVVTSYGLKGTFNVTLRSRIPLADMQKLFLDRGHEIAVHGKMHMAPGLSCPVDCIQDMLNCRLELEKTFGQIIRGMAYPDSGITHLQNGVSYENIRRYLQDLGIVYARTLGGDNDLFRLPTDWMAWMPTAHHVNSQLMEYIDKFRSIDPDQEKLYYSDRYPRLFYLWGHSFEFNNNNNWELLDTICEKLGGHEDIWYATNYEIWEYIENFKRLVFSLDEKYVYNPTAQTICFMRGATLYTVEAGKTICTK